MNYHMNYHMNYRMHEAAAEDCHRAIDELAGIDLALAEDFLARLEKVTDDICRHPQAWSPMDACIRRHLLRQFNTPANKKIAGVPDWTDCLLESLPAVYSAVNRLRL